MVKMSVGDYLAFELDHLLNTWLYDTHSNYSLGYYCWVFLIFSLIQHFVSTHPSFIQEVFIQYWYACYS